MLHQIHSPTPGLELSLHFYRQLQFTVLSESTPTLVSDGQVVIEINPDRFARAGIKMFNETWRTQVGKLSELTKVIALDGAYLLSDPCGSWIYLHESRPQVPNEWKDLPASILGNCGGVSLEATDLPAVAQIYELLGFEQSMGTVDQGWIALQHAEGLSISIMKALSCPHLFFNPSLSYFNGQQNNAIIENIRKLQIPIAEEITVFNKEGIVDNVIIRDPGGYGFFIFND